MEERAQGALEYLLLIAGGVLVAAIVLTLLPKFVTPAKHTAGHQLHNFLQHVQ